MWAGWQPGGECDQLEARWSAALGPDLEDGGLRELVEARARDEVGSAVLEKSVQRVFFGGHVKADVGRGLSPIHEVAELSLHLFRWMWPWRFS